MFEDLRTRMRERYEYVRERDRRWILRYPIERLNKYVFVLLTPYLILNFLDVATTLYAMQFPQFRELNPLAAALFGDQFLGFVVALAFKYSPAFVLTYIAFANDKSSAHPVGIRVAKLSALVVLVAGNAFYVYVVGSNLGNLFRLLF